MTAIGQLPLFNSLEPFTPFPDLVRIGRVAEKNVRGRAYRQIGESLVKDPIRYSYAPRIAMFWSEMVAFEETAGGLGP